MAAQTQTFPTVPQDPRPHPGLAAGPFAHIGDIADALPEKARAKLVDLRQRADDSSSLARSAMDQREEARIQRLELHTRLNRLTRPVAEGGFGLSGDDAQVQDIQKQFDKVNAVYNRVNQLSEMRAAQRSSAQRLVDHIEKYLLKGPPSGMAFAICNEPALPVLKNGDVLDAIEGRRRRIRELAAASHQINSSPYPSSIAKQRMRAQVDALSEQGRPSVLGLVEAGSPIEFATTQIRSRVYNSEPAAVAFTENLPNALALVAWLHRDALVKALDREIADCSDDAAALTDEQRREQETVIRSDTLAEERIECALVEVATAHGLPVSAREDCSVLAVLGLQLVEMT